MGDGLTPWLMAASPCLPGCPAGQGPGGGPGGVRRLYYPGPGSPALRIEIIREEVAAPDAEATSIVATGPLTSDSLGRGEMLGKAHRTRTPALLRRHRPHRAAPAIDVAASGPPATGAGTTTSTARLTGLSTTPFSPRSSRPSRTSPRGFEEPEVLRGLPAGRGHGRAGAGDAGPRPHEAGGPGRPAHRGAAALRGGPAPRGQRRPATPSTWSASRPGWRPAGAGARVPADPRPGTRRVPAARQHPPQHLHRLAPTPRSCASLSRPTPASFSPARSPGWKDTVESASAGIIAGINAARRISPAGRRWYLRP